MRRAIRDDQKEQRRQKIVEVAWGLFQTQSYDTINMAEVAQGAGVAKGTLYLYFQTKEELFLAVLEQQFERWFEGVNMALASLSSPSTPAIVVTTLTDALVAHPALIRLFAISHSILEYNVGYEAIVHFKQLSLEQIGRTGLLLEQVLPSLNPGDGAMLLRCAYAFIIGLYGMAEPAPAVRQVLTQEPTLAAHLLDFASTFQRTMLALIRGWHDSG